jgi:hypothetical protein
MAIKYLKSSQLHFEAMKKMSVVPSIIDIGPGIAPQKFVASKVHVCAEPYQEYANILLENEDVLVINSDWEGVIKNFLNDSIGSIILVDVIEHLEKENAEILLKKSLEIAKFQVIIFTPYGFMPQYHHDKKDAWGLNGGDWQNHKSGWKPEDFKEEGWDFFISKDFHQYNNFGENLLEPFGAFWAIYTKKTYNSLNLKLKLKKYSLLANELFKKSIFGKISRHLLHILKLN